jgi:probable O-glycosylation ligase (exosortase A-associated)
MVLITFFLVGNKDELQKLVWILALSVGFFGIKGGLFTIASGGSYRVWGPEGTFIGDNNTLALAVIMVVPLFRYLQMHSENRWVRRACVAAMFLCTVSAVGSYSRGALLALLAMVSFIWLKSRTKAITGILIVAALPVVFNLMPESWMGRMNTIGTYDTDGSALGRINAWWTAWNIALNRFPIGAGFDMYTPEVFGRYAPNPLAIHAAHSIYFQVLGDHGFVGLGLFLAVFGFAWVAGRWVVNNTRGQPSLDWAHDMAAMLQVSLIGYAVGGAFLSLSYYDFPYYVAAMLAILRILVKNELASAATLPIVLKSKVDIARVAKVGAK